jgi:hypothetical protein
MPSTTTSANSALAADLSETCPSSPPTGSVQARRGHVLRVKDAWNESSRTPPATPGGPGMRSRTTPIDRGLRRHDRGRDRGRPRLRPASRCRPPPRERVRQQRRPRVRGAALHENEADFEHGIRRAIDDALKQAGL